MRGISRLSGYKAGAGKEEPALKVFESFLSTCFDVRAVRIVDPTENYDLGDFRLPGGNTIECKGQPIDPEKFTSNFVEVFEDTSRGRHERHSSGFDAVAEALALSSAELAAVSVTPKKRHLPARSPLGRVPYVSASIHTFVRASGVVYVNAEKRIVALYESKSLLRSIRDAMANAGLMRGAGYSNDDTFSVFVPYPRLLWRGTGARFEYAGAGSPTTAAGTARAILGT